jgi:hypothetical protein
MAEKLLKLEIERTLPKIQAKLRVNPLVIGQLQKLYVKNRGFFVNRCLFPCVVSWLFRKGGQVVQLEN